MKKLRKNLHRVSLVQAIREVLQAYLKSQFILMVVIGLVSFLILHFMHVQYALVLGGVTGALSVIPMLGIITAALFASVVATFDDARFVPNAPEIVEGLIILGIYVLLNFIVDTLVSPYLTGRVIHIHPLLILMTVVIGSALLGIVGAILAVPFLLVALTTFEYVKQRTTN